MKESKKVVLIWIFTIISICLFVVLFGLHFYYDRTINDLLYVGDDEQDLMEDEYEGSYSYKHHGVVMLTGIFLLNLGVLVHFLIRNLKNRRVLHLIHVIIQMMGVVLIVIGFSLAFVSDKADPLGLEYSSGKLHTFCGAVLLTALVMQMVIGGVDFLVDITNQSWLDNFPNVHGYSGTWIIINMMACYFTGLGYRYYLDVGYEKPEIKDPLFALHMLSLVLVICLIPTIVLYHYKEQLMSSRIPVVAPSRGSRASIARPSTF